MSDCPCGSGTEFSACCEPFISGAKLPDTAAELMRSRYSAFATGAVDYILDTHDPATREGIVREEIEQWSANSEWNGFEILETVDGGIGDEWGEVSFVAHYAQEGTEYDHPERSEFVHTDGRWLFHEAHPLRGTTIVREEPKVGRNDPCPCGSGKKYKKCCGMTA